MLTDEAKKYIDKYVGELKISYKSMVPVRNDIVDYATNIASELSTETRPITTNKVIEAMLLWYRDNGPKEDEVLLMYVDDLVEGGK